MTAILQECQKEKFSENCAKAVDILQFRSARVSCCELKARQYLFSFEIVRNVIQNDIDGARSIRSVPMHQIAAVVDYGAKAKLLIVVLCHAEIKL